jgi:hypothetical protein
LRAQPFGALRTNIVRDGSAAKYLAIFFDEEDMAKARLPLALSPGIHAVAKCARTPAWRWDRPYRGFGAFFQNAGEHPEAGAAKNLRHILHLDGIAQVRLVGAILA